VVNLSRTLRSILLSFVIVGLLVSAGHLLAAEPTPDDARTALVQVRDGRLTATLQGADLEAVLKEIARQADIEISMPSLPKQTVSVELRDLSIEEGLRRLLRGHGWVLSYRASAPGAKAALEKVIVLPVGEGGRPGQRAPQPNRKEALVRTVAALLDREEVKKRLRMYGGVSITADSRDALLGVLDAVGPDGVPVMIEILSEKDMRSTDWATALAPLFGMIPLGEQHSMLRALREPATKASLVKMLEMYAAARSGRPAREP